MKFSSIPGATPIDTDAARELIPPLTTQEQLNEFEQTNITAAMEWAVKSRKLRAELLTIDGILLLHRKMFEHTWRWAGKFRRKDLNIGIAWAQIPEQTKALCDDVTFWDANRTFGAIEIAVRFHHRLVSIHPFLNGNGRLSRLAADLYLLYRKEKRLTWGGEINILESGPHRAKYIAALREADDGQYEPLIAFASKI